MRIVPSTVEIAPIPHDFTIPIEVDDNGTVRTKMRIGGLLYELGLRPDNDGEVASREILRNGMWQLTEFERLGRQDLMAYAAADRHARRRN